MSEEKAAAAAPAAAANSGGGGNKLVLILSLVNTLAAIAMVAILFISFQRDKKPANVDDIAHGEHSEGGDHGGGGGGHGEAAGGHGEAAGGHGDAKAAKKKANSFGKMVPLDLFTVNLSTPGSINTKFVRVNVALELPNEDTEAEVTQKMPQVRNAIIDLFNSKRPVDIATAEGRDYVKEEIRNALNSFMVTGKIKGVFFTNIAVGG